MAVRRHSWIWWTRRPVLVVGLVSVLAGGLLAVLPAPVASAQPAVPLYVSTSGSDGGGTNTCTASATPCLTIQQAINEAQTNDAGDDVSINVATGSYDENDTVNASGLNSLTIAGPATANATVNGTQAGAVFTVNNGMVTVSGLTITNGKRGILDTGGTVTVTDSTLSGNTASGSYEGRGGGILTLPGATVNVMDSTLSDNSATAGGGIGQYTGGTVNVTDSTLSDNTAASSGGAGIDAYSGLVTVTDSTVSDNTGGGIGNFGGTVLVNDSTVSGNSGFNAIGSYEGSVTVTDSTVSGNSSVGATFPGAIDDDYATVSLVATILANNVGGDCFTGGGVTDLGYNIDDDASCFFNATTSINSSATLDADLGPLQNNGGPTDTIALLPGSPAIGLVNNSGFCLSPDQRGVVRPTPCDAGAYQTPSSGGGGGGGGSSSGGGGCASSQCSVSVDTNNGTSQVTGMSVGTGIILENVTTGSLDCSGEDYSTQVIQVQSTTTFPLGLTVTNTIDNASDAKAYVTCYSGPASSASAARDTAGSPAGDTTDSSVTTGFLAPCPTPITGSTGPCVISQRRKHGDVIIKLHILDGDPRFWSGKTPKPKK